MSNAFGHVLRSELVKLQTLRSIVVTIAATVVGTVGLAYVAAVSARNAIDSDSPILRPDFTPEASGFHAAAYGQVGIIVVGVLLVSSEYVGGQIRASLTSVPSRGLLLAGKTTALAAVSLLVAAPTIVASFVVTQTGLGPHGVALERMAEGEIVRALAGATAYWVLIALLALALTTLTRNAVIPLVILIPTVMALSHFLQTILPAARYLPDLAGARMYDLGDPPPDALGPAAGGAVMAVWVLAFSGAAYLLFRRRDA